MEDSELGEAATIEIVFDKRKLATVNIDNIRPNTWNPKLENTMEYRRIKRSLEQNGQKLPIVVRENDGYEIIDGEQRWRALKELESRVALIYNEGKVDDQSAKELTIAYEQQVPFDDTQLAILLNEMEQLYDNIQVPYSETEVDEIKGMLSTLDTAGSIKEDDPPAVSEEEPITQYGDLWLLAKHRVLCGDSTKAEDVERVMGGEKAVLMATDPPYGDSWVQKARDMAAHGYVHSRAELHGSIESDNLNEADLKAFLDAFLYAAKCAGEPPFPAYVWHRAKRMLFEQSLIDAGYHVHQPVIWVKPGFVIGRLHYHPRCEWALHGWLTGNGPCPFYGERNQSDVWEVDRENDRVHPTQKPVELFAKPIRNHTLDNEVCYDPFAGSGTQVIAAEQLGRRCFSIELECKYCDVIVQRYINHVGTDEDVFVERDGKTLTWREVQLAKKTKVSVF